MDKIYKIFQTRLNHTDLLRVYVPVVFFFYFVASLFRVNEDTIVDHFAFESFILIIVILLVIPSVFRVPKDTRSQKYKNYVKFYKNNYAHFIQYMTVIIAVPVVATIVTWYLMGVIGAVRHEDIGYPLQYPIVLPTLLVSAHLLKASEVLGISMKSRIFYLGLTVLYVGLLWSQVHLSIMRPLYYLIVSLFI